MDIWYIIVGCVAFVLFIFGTIFGRLQRKYSKLGDTNYFQTGMFDLTSNYEVDGDEIEQLENTVPVIIQSTLVEDSMERADIL